MSKQLQARSDESGFTDTLRLKMDARSKRDVELLKAFARKGLNVNPSTTVLVRRALAVYLGHLTCELGDITSIDDSIDRLVEFQNFLDIERESIFHAAGRPEKASEREYETQINEDKGGHS